MDWNIEKRCITWLLFVLNGLHFFDLYFQMQVMSKRRLRIFLIFIYEMLCHWSTSGTNLVGMIRSRQEMWLLLHSSIKLIFVTDFDKETSLTCRVWIGKLFLQV